MMEVPLDHRAPPDTARMRCHCRFVGDMRLWKVRASDETWVATCPKCGRFLDVDGTEEHCDNCRCLVDKRYPAEDGDRICLWCLSMSLVNGMEST